MDEIQPQAADTAEDHDNCEMREDDVEEDAKDYSC